jgi:hypothetical protein
MAVFAHTHSRLLSPLALALLCGHSEARESCARRSKGTTCDTRSCWAGSAAPFHNNWDRTLAPVPVPGETYRGCPRYLSTSAGHRLCHRHGGTSASWSNRAAVRRLMMHSAAIQRRASTKTHRLTICVMCRTAYERASTVPAPCSIPTSLRIRHTARTPRSPAPAKKMHCSHLRRVKTFRAIAGPHPSPKKPRPGGAPTLVAMVRNSERHAVHHQAERRPSKLGAPGATSTILPAHRALTASIPTGSTDFHSGLPT